MILAARMCALWLWSHMYTVARSGSPAASRAATKASTLAADPPLVKSPPALSGYPIQRRNQSITHELKLTRPARHQPGALIDVVSGRHEVGQHPGPRGRRRYKTEFARVVMSQGIRENFPCGLFNDLQRRPALVGRILHQLIDEPLPELSIPGIFSRQAFASLDEHLHDPVSRAPAWLPAPSRGRRDSAGRAHPPGFLSFSWLMNSLLLPAMGPARPGRVRNWPTEKRRYPRSQ